MATDLHILRDALLDITGVLNRPQPDAALLASAGVKLDRALFRPLVGIARRGPLAIGEIADLCGRDYTTLSRQITKLESLGLVMRRARPDDARVTEVAITAKGRKITAAIDSARERAMTAVLADWSNRDVAELARLLRRLADDALAFTRESSAN